MTDTLFTPRPYNTEAAVYLAQLGANLRDDKERFELYRDAIFAEAYDRNWTDYLVRVGPNEPQIRVQVRKAACGGGCFCAAEIRPHPTVNERN